LGAPEEYEPAPYGETLGEPCRVSSSETGKSIERTCSFEKDQLIGLVFP